VVWAASFLGAWAGAVVADRVTGGSGGIGWMAGGAVGLTLVAVAGWVALLRRHARADGSSAGRETEGEHASTP